MPGSGLGLAIVRQIVDGHGGRVQLRPRPGGGTVAFLELPPVLLPPNTAASFDAELAFSGDSAN